MRWEYQYKQVISLSPRKLSLTVSHWLELQASINASMLGKNIQQITCWNSFLFFSPENRLWQFMQSVSANCLIVRQFTWNTKHYFFCGIHECLHVARCVKHSAENMKYFSFSFARFGEQALSFHANCMKYESLFSGENITSLSSEFTVSVVKAKISSGIFHACLFHLIHSSG